jgi:hypothetical protein
VGKAGGAKSFLHGKRFSRLYRPWYYGFYSTLIKSLNQEKPENAAERN